MDKEKRLLGHGKARDFEAKPGESLIEVGDSVFAVSLDFFCKSCEGSGCKACQWTGESRHRKRKS